MSSTNNNTLATPVVQIPSAWMGSDVDKQSARNASSAEAAQIIKLRKLKAEADALAKAEADALAKAEADAKAKEVADAKAEKKADAKAKAVALAKAKAEALGAQIKADFIKQQLIANQKIRKDLKEAKAREAQKKLAEAEALILAEKKKQEEAKALAREAERKLREQQRLLLEAEKINKAKAIEEAEKLKREAYAIAAAKPIAEPVWEKSKATLEKEKQEAKKFQPKIKKFHSKSSKPQTATVTTDNVVSNVTKSAPANGYKQFTLADFICKLE